MELARVPVIRELRGDLWRECGQICGEDNAGISGEDIAGISSEIHYRWRADSGGIQQSGTSQRLKFSDDGGIQHTFQSNQRIRDTCAVHQAVVIRQDDSTILLFVQRPVGEAGRVNGWRQRNVDTFACQSGKEECADAFGTGMFADIQIPPQMMRRRNVGRAANCIHSAKVFVASDVWKWRMQN